MDFGTLLHDFGPILGLVLFYIWRDAQREKRNNTRQDKLDKEVKEREQQMVQRQEANDVWVKELFLPAIQNSTKALEATAQVIGENNVILTGIHQVIQTHVLITEATNKILVRLTKPAKAARKR